MPPLARRLSPLLALVLAACSGCAAPEATRPEPLAPEATLSGTYSYDHEVGVFDGTDFVPEPTSDVLVLIERGDSLAVAFDLVRTNAHLCSFGGTMTRERGVWTWHETLDLGDAPEACMLTLEVTADSLTLHDRDGVCRQYYCGARAAIDGAAFARDAWTPDTSWTER